MKRHRRTELRLKALQYMGDLLCELVNTYEAFDDLPHDERAFIDAYIVETGQQLIDRAHRTKGPTP